MKYPLLPSAQTVKSAIYGLCAKKCGWRQKSAIVWRDKSHIQNPVNNPQAALLPQTDLRKAMLEGKHDAGIIFVNTAIDNIHHIISCQQPIAELMADFHPSV